MKGNWLKRLTAALLALALLSCAVGALAEEYELGEGGVVSNDPADTYESALGEKTISSSCSLTMNAGEKLLLDVVGGTAESWSTSKDSVARVTFDGERALVDARSEGSAKLTAKLKSGGRYTVKLTVNNPNTPTGIGFDITGLSLCVGRSYDLSEDVVLKPENAQTTLTWKSSKSAVAKVDSYGVVTGRKQGSAKITVTTKNKKKATLNVTVAPNKVANLSGRPTSAAIAAVKGGWTLWPLSAEVLSGGSIQCEFYLLNGTAGKSDRIESLALALAVGSRDNVIAQRGFSTVKVACKSGEAKSFKVTFPASSVTNSDLMLSDYADSIYFIVSDAWTPRLRASKQYYEYIPTVLADEDVPAAKYRALLIGEQTFDPKCTRNASDVTLMEDMLSKVTGPTGGRYQVTKAIDQTEAGVLSLIETAFEGATEDDVSLFFIATHGDTTYSDERAGRLSMVGSDPMTLGTLASALSRVKGRVIVLLESCGSGAGIYAMGIQQNSAAAVEAETADFNQAVIDAFAAVDRPVWTSDVRANTGEFLGSDKFYVLTCSRYQENSYGTEPGHNYFTKWLVEGVVSGNSMPADVNPQDRCVTLAELFAYISKVGDNYAMHLKDKTGSYYQHVQVYPKDCGYAMFKR